MSKYTPNFLTYDIILESYGVRREILDVLRHRKHIPECSYKKIGKQMYVDINWFIRQHDYKIKAKEMAQKAVYFLELFGSSVNAAKIVTNKYCGSETFLEKSLRYDIFSLNNESLTYLTWNKSIIKFAAIYRTIKARLNIAGLKFDDAFEDENYECAKLVYDSLLTNEEVVTMKDFDKVEDYYDYFEAQRILKNVRKETTRTAYA